MPPFIKCSELQESSFLDVNNYSGYPDCGRNRPKLLREELVSPDEAFEDQDIMPSLTKLSVRMELESKGDREHVLNNSSYEDGDDKLKPFKSSLKKLVCTPSSSFQETSSNDKNSVQTPRTLRKKTSFSTIEIREYNVTVGEHPGSSSRSTGTPVSICWEFDKESVQLHDVDAFEEIRPPRRSHNQLYMTPRERFHRLLQHGCTVDEMLLGAQDAKRTREQRRHTNILNSFANIPMQQAIRCTHKKLKSAFKTKRTCSV